MSDVCRVLAQLEGTKCPSNLLLNPLLGSHPQVRAIFGFTFSLVPEHVVQFFTFCGLHRCSDDRELVEILHEIGSWAIRHGEALVIGA